MANKTPFAQTLRKLRETRKISQKLVSQELGISQALLSHYEKGVRECGLNFLIKAAKYYGVSTDFLLGLESSAQGSEGRLKEKKDTKKRKEARTEIKLETKAEASVNNAAEIRHNNYPVLYKNLLTNVINYIFSSMKDADYRHKAKISGEYMLLSTYVLYRYLTGGSPNAECISLEEAAAAELVLIAEIKRNGEHSKISLASEFAENEYINTMIKNCEMILKETIFR